MSGTSEQQYYDDLRASTQQHVDAANFWRGESARHEAAREQLLAAYEAEHTAMLTAQLRHYFIDRTRAVMTNTAKWVLSGSSIRWESSGASPLSDRLITMGAGEGAYGASDGHYNVRSPAVGAVVKSLSGGADLVVDSSGFIPLLVQTSLYFKMPAPNTVHSAGNSLEFFYAGWNAGDYVIPDDYIYLGTVNHEDFNGTVFTRWDKQIITQGDNWPDTNWQSLSQHLVPNLSNYGNDFADIRYRRQGNRVYLEGMLNTLQSAYVGGLATLPAGFRPKKQHVFAAAVHSGLARIDIGANGLLQVITNTGGQAWISLSNISYSLS